MKVTYLQTSGEDRTGRRTKGHNPGDRTSRTDSKATGKIDNRVIGKKGLRAAKPSKVVDNVATILNDQTVSAGTTATMAAETPTITRLLETMAPTKKHGTRINERKGRLLTRNAKDLLEYTSSAISWAMADRWTKLVTIKIDGTQWMTRMIL